MKKKIVIEKIYSNYNFISRENHWKPFLSSFSRHSLDTNWIILIFSLLLLFTMSHHHRSSSILILLPFIRIIFFWKKLYLICLLCIAWSNDNGKWRDDDDALTLLWLYFWVTWYKLFLMSKLLKIIFILGIFTYRKCKWIVLFRTWPNFLKDDFKKRILVVQNLRSIAV